MIQKIFFITGASGVGKTTLLTDLKKKYKNNTDFVFINFDSIKIPSEKQMIKQYGSIKNWQKQETEKWIKKILFDFLNKKYVFFEGQVNLKFIKDGFKKNNFTKYEIILIDCNEEKMITRLLNNRKQPELVTENMKNWLKFLKAQAKRYNAQIIDNTNKTRKELLESFEKIFNIK